jgi:hypothetical protein
LEDGGGNVRWFAKICARFVGFEVSQLASELQVRYAREPHVHDRGVRAQLPRPVERLLGCGVDHAGGGRRHALGINENSAC